MRNRSRHSELELRGPRSSLKKGRALSGFSRRRRVCQRSGSAGAPEALFEGVRGAEPPREDF
eukprot:11135010-Alexandrium_andersonii.AAC.1